uniref:Protein KTI12 homolog n=1 Tax=Astatotilapia calliptera TaxID=8154 RepID=A0AAX7V3H8_ASTCA
MPLIVMCGYPCSGKSRRAEELKVYFEESTERKVHIVGDGSLGVEKNTVYADSQKEKNVRASLKAEVERKVNKDDIVILDSLNYIKGYRYELFCLIKHAQTPHCLVSRQLNIHFEKMLPSNAIVVCLRVFFVKVYSLTSHEESSLWNTNRDAADEYNQDIFDALVQRFEAPDSRNRWDSPLFTILKDDTLPVEAISDALFKRKAPPPNQSTQSQPLSSANFLYELDKITQDVLMAIFNAQKTSVPGDLIAVPGASEKISFFKHNLRVPSYFEHTILINIFTLNRFL